MTKPESVIKNKKLEIFWDFRIQMDLPIQDLVLINQKITFYIVGFAVAAIHRVKIKESGKFGKYLDSNRKPKRLWNMKVTVILIIQRTEGKRQGYL